MAVTQIHVSPVTDVAYQGVPSPQSRRKATDVLGSRHANYSNKPYCLAILLQWQMAEIQRIPLDVEWRATSPQSQAACVR